MFTAFMLLLTMHASAAREPQFVDVQRSAVTSCMTPAEARTAIAHYKLANPLPALRATSRRAQAEPLRSRLCRIDERFVYEMTMLRRDGKVVRVFVDAQDARTLVPAPR